MEPARRVHARFVARENRFVVRAERRGGTVRAYLPNTARLADVLVPRAPLVLVPADDPRRRTRWTVTRVWDGTWVALDAAAAADLVAGRLREGGALPGWPATVGLRREVACAGHRFDLALDLADGTGGLVEVKSLSRARDGVAPLSSTPSSRGVAHLGALAGLAGAGWRAAVVFVVQRSDARVLDLAAPADPAWVAAVRDARERGVAVAAYACDVDEREIALGAPLPVRDGAGSPG